VTACGYGVHFLLAKQEHEIPGKATAIAPHCFIQALQWHFIERCDIGIEDNSVASNQKD
jgi:hypothetical protein